MSPVEARLRELLERRILILDGAMGTMILSLIHISEPTRPY